MLGDGKVVMAKSHPSLICALGYRSMLRTSLSRPLTAAAAAISGLTKWVRAPRPCRPSKLRLEVEAHLFPGSTRSGFIPKHIEQPDSRH